MQLLDLVLFGDISELLQEALQVTGQGQADIRIFDDVTLETYVTQREHPPLLELSRQLLELFVTHHYQMLSGCS